MNRLIQVLALLISIPAVYALEKGENWEAKKQEQFAKLKELKIQAFREKISILQDASSCVQSAQNHEALKPCDERESNAMKDHQQRMKERWESLKQK